MFGPRHTIESVTKELIDGLEEGTVLLRLPEPTEAEIREFGIGGQDCSAEIPQATFALGHAKHADGDRDFGGRFDCSLFASAKPDGKNGPLYGARGQPDRWPTWRHRGLCVRIQERKADGGAEDVYARASAGRCGHRAPASASSEIGAARESSCPELPKRLSESGMEIRATHSVLGYIGNLNSPRRTNSCPSPPM